MNNKTKVNNHMHLQTALFIGRFQPFHNGHLEVIRSISQKSKRLIIVIGSAQESETFINPFSSSERRKMIELVLSAEGINNFCIAEVSDINDNAKWVNHVKEKLVMFTDDHEFHHVHTGSELTRNLFVEAGYKVEWIPERIAGISASEIRLRILKDMPWEHLVPRQAYDYILSIGGDKRIKCLSKHQS
jgi:nicotinamide-nucleotide adenylyltransferase